MYSVFLDAGGKLATFHSYLTQLGWNLVKSCAALLNGGCADAVNSRSLLVLLGHKRDGEWSVDIVRHGDAAAEFMPT